MTRQNIGVDPIEVKIKEVENVFQNIGGFTWEQAEIWAGFCDAVGMDVVPFLKVMLGNICEIRTSGEKGGCLQAEGTPELRIKFKGARTKFELVESDS